ncbi:MAG: 3-dehydroquinate synthase [Planctomycetota bacterium JB042]
MRVEVSSARGPYPVVVEPGGLARADAEIEAAAPEATGRVVVTDEHVDAHHGAALREHLSPSAVLVLPPGEEGKTFRNAERLLDRLVEHGLDRRGVVVAFGGGVVTDLAGFAAAIHLRGVRSVLMPTSLLAMVDASIGGKTGVDTPRGKNLVGAFWPPRLVLSDPELLATLPRREWIGGLAEVVKTALIADAPLFEELEAASVDALRADPRAAAGTVARCARAKAALCSRDERDDGERQLLNLGHTIGHALEAATGYRSLAHGEAVAVGLVAEARLAERLGLAADGLAARIAALCRRLELPVRGPAVEIAHVRSFLRSDKKREGRALRFALPVAVGRVERVDVEDEAAIDLVLAEAVAEST